ncbi:MAG TPA: hybrid sensor histidine kinase/response regulator [Thermoanaerobaculia bacterium]|nr:hybrid sensor histidine kinase/response regulator [Thermoanaerobaculia bacterium]
MKIVPFPLPETDRSRDEFLMKLGHELRGSLAPICNALYLLHHRPDDLSTVLSTLGIFERQVGHLVRLVDDLLDMSRIAQGQVGLQREDLDLRRLVDEVVERRRPSFEAAGIALDLQLAAEPLWIRGDRVRLIQILGNVLDNALKFTDTGGSVHVRLAAPGKADQAVLTVRDTGIGIDAERLAQLFDSFPQADRSLTRGRGGLGIGLTVAKGLIELHGGTIAAASAGIGKGAELTLRFPRVAAPQSREAEPGPSSPYARPLSVAIIEDSLDTAESLGLLLDLLGYTVSVAHSGARGVEVVRKVRPDVVLLDIGLPEMDGFEVARVLKADPATAGCHLVAITGYDQEEDRRRATEAGFEHHLVKPVEPGTLEALIKSIRKGRGV